VSRTVVLLRSVNIGGRRLSMAALRDGLHEAGCRDVVTYVQSGNVVLIPPTDVDGHLGRWLEAHVSDLAGFPVAVVLRSAAELRAVVAANPYPDAGGTHLHVVFFAGEQPVGLLDGVDLTAHAPEHGTAMGREIYLHLPQGMGRATLPVALEKLTRRSAATVATTRNWNTVLELLRLSTG
jgi:uncharacterized protein (DUF1697 family)